MESSALFAQLALTQLGDSALPTGAFTHSLGFEYYLDGQISDASSFQSWLQAFIRQQLTYSDGPAIALSMRGSAQEIQDLDALLYAQALPVQIRQANVAMGQRLLAIAAAHYPSELLTHYQSYAHGHPAVVWGLVARELQVAPTPAIAHHMLSTCIGLTQNAVRGIPLGQSAGQEIIRACIPLIEQASSQAQKVPVAELGQMVPGLEIAQMRHERQRARMFMS